MTNRYFVCGEHEEPRCCTIILDIQRSALLYRKWIFTLRLMKHEFSRLHLNYSPILICNKKLMILAAFPPPDIYILCWFMNDDVFYSAQSCVRWFISQTGFTAGFQLWMWSIDAFDHADVQTEGPTFHLRTFMLACTCINCSKWFWLCTTIHLPRTFYESIIQTDTSLCAHLSDVSGCCFTAVQKLRLKWHIMIRSLCILDSR